MLQPGMCSATVSVSSTWLGPPGAALTPPVGIFTRLGPCAGPPGQPRERRSSWLRSLRDAGAEAFGIEVDGARAEQCREKGHRVQRANFLETAPTGDYDRVVMNPPFYGTHYARHVEHALRYLRPGGILIAILPAAARYEHGLLTGSWEDLPVGSFSESGTNVNTSVLTLRRPLDPS